MKVLGPIKNVSTFFLKIFNSGFSNEANTSLKNVHSPLKMLIFKVKNILET